MTASRDDRQTDTPIDDDLAEERAGQSTTAEEAMDAATDEEGYAHESVYTPSLVQGEDLDS